MHEISKRQHKLLRLLLEQKDFLPVNHFSKILSISDRTLYKDIDELNKALKKRKIEILKRQGKGIFLSKSDLSNDEILKIFGEASTRAANQNGGIFIIEKQKGVLPTII